MFLAMLFLQSTRALASVKRIGEVMNTKLDVADSEHSIILDQVENGVAVRMAVLYLLADRRN